MAFGARHFYTHLRGTAGAQGLTLIELAVVIAIVAMLATVAIARYTDVTMSSERAAVQDFTMKLASSAALYMAEQGTGTSDFNDFVKTTPVLATDTEVISTSTIGQGGCTVSSPTTIDCLASDFPNINQELGVTVQFTLGTQGEVANNVPR